VFGQKLANFQNTQFKLATQDQATVARVFTDRCISLFMEGKLDPVDAAMGQDVHFRASLRGGR